MNKKKRALLIVGIIFVILIAVAVVVVSLLLKTDIFKTNQQMFMKYSTQLPNIVEAAYPSKFITNLDDVSKVSNTSSTEITGSLNLVKDENVESALKKMTLKIDGKSSAEQNRKSADINLMIDDYNLFNCNYLRNGDKYALKSDEIVTAYLGLENKNLKDFAQKMGQKNVDQIPDKIENDNLTKILQITDQEKSTIINSYSKLIFNNISKDKYSKSKDVSLSVSGQNLMTNVYTVALNQGDIYNLETSILEYAKQDSVLLNLISSKAKLIGNNDVTIESISKQMQDMINNINEEKQKSSNLNNEILRVNLYIYNEQVIKIENVIKEKNTMSIQFINNGDEQQIKVDFSIPEDSKPNDSNILEEFETMPSIIITKKIENNKVTMDYNVESKTTKYEIKNVTTGSVPQNDIKVENTIIITGKKIVSTINTKTKVNVTKVDNIPELTQDNSAMANDLSYEQNKTLNDALVNRINTVLNEKKQYIAMTYEGGLTGIDDVDNIIKNNNITVYQAKEE